MSRRHVRVVAYASLPGEDALADPVAFLDRSTEAQIAQIRAWADSRRATVAHVLTDRGPAGLDGIGRRTQFANALSMIRDGKADLMCIASLDSLASDVLLQELLLSEARHSHVTVESARAEDAPQLATPPADPRRALIREVLQQAPEFQGQMRSLRAQMRRSQWFAETEYSALARIEAMEERGASANDIASVVPGALEDPAKKHRLVDLLRKRRAGWARS